MAQSDHHILTHSKAYLFASCTLVLLCIGYLATAQLFAGIITALLCVTLFALRWPPAFVQKWPDNLFLKGCSLALAVLSLWALWRDPQGTQTWLYAVPLMVFFIFEFKPAIWLVGAYTLLLSIVLGQQQDPINNVLFAWQYVLLIGISFSLVYLRELRRRQLKPLRRTDNLTSAATREHLDDDLTKEIQRSEREGCDLAIMALAIDPNCLSRLSPKQQDIATIDIGRLLHNNLRLFDSYYLWQAHEFLIVLPHTSSAQAIKIANALRVKVRKEITAGKEDVTISVGISGLNVGDDSQSLCQRATEALRHIQKKGENRTQLFREEDTATPGQANQEEGRQDP